MIFFANAQGNITRIIPDSIYQNSHRSSEVVLVAPFSKNVSVGVAFNLPNGMRTSLNFAQPNMGEIDLTDIMDGNGTGYNAWRCLLEQTVTEYAGEVGVQFFVYNGYNVNGNLNLEILATYQSTFNVIKGVSYIPPVVDEDSDVPIYNQIMAYLSMLQASGEGGTYEPIISTEPAIADGIEYPVTIRPDRTAYVLIPFNAGGGGSGGGESTSGGTAGVSYELSTNGTYAICTGIGTATATDILLASTYEGVPVTTIGEGAFNGSNITSITISDNITAIMDDAFANCASLLSINVTTGNTAYKSINGVLYSEYETALIKYPDGKSGATLTLPSTLTEIKPYAINNTALTLIDATACERVPELGEYNFINRNSDLKIQVPYGLYNTWVAREDWANYSNIITSNAIDEGSTPGLAYSIANNVATCTGIGTATDTNIVISSVYNGVPVKTIGAEAFKQDDLVSVTIPDSVTSIGNYAFSMCTSLASIQVDSNNTAYKSVNDDLYNKSGTTLIQYAVGKTATSFTAPNSVTAIGIGAIAEAINLTSAYFKSDVIAIGADAFLNCSNLTVLDFINNTTVPTLGINALYNTNSSLDIFVPSNLLTAWKSDPDWSAYESQIMSYSSLTYRLSTDGTYAICTGGSGGATHVIIASEYEGVPVTEIIQKAFRNNYIVTASLPSTIQNISFQAFYGCNNLKIVNLNAAKIGYYRYSFDDCNNIEEFVVSPASEELQSIDGNVYSKDGTILCMYAPGKAATSFTIPDGVKTISQRAIMDSNNLESITIPNSVTAIGAYAFTSSESLTTVDCTAYTSASSIPTLGTNAFLHTSDNLKIVVPDDLYTSWINETNWSAYADKIVRETERTDQ